MEPNNNATILAHAYTGWAIVDQFGVIWQAENHGLFNDDGLMWWSAEPAQRSRETSQFFHPIHRDVTVVWKPA